MSESEVGSALELLDHWRQRVRTLQKLHYDRAEHFTRKNGSLGVPAAILSGVAGTSVLISIVEPLGVYAKIAVGLVSLIAAGLSIFQTSVKFDELAQKHRAAGIGYGALNRTLEHAIAMPPVSEEGARILVARVEEQLNQLAQHVPPIPRSVFANLPAEYVPQRGKVDLAGRTNAEFSLLTRKLTLSGSESESSERPVASEVRSDE